MFAQSSALEPAMHAVALLLAAIGAFTDWRRGEIPNWLTLPPLLLAPVAHGLVDGFMGLTGSLAGMLLCSLVPLLVFWKNGMAGGDVKLFAAIGAVGGVYVGLEAEFMAVVVASLYALGGLIWSGGLGRALGRSVFIALNPVLPRRLRRPIPEELLTRIRLGAAIFVGTAIAVAGHHRDRIG